MVSATHKPRACTNPDNWVLIDYATDAPPDIRHVEETPMHSSPYTEPPKLSARPGPVLLPPRPRSTSVPPTPMTVQRMAKRYMPVTENVTPPISPACASAMDPGTDPDTPPPTQRPGRSRGHGKWRAPQSATPGVGTRSQTRKAELDAAEATLAQASRAVWPEQPDRTLQIQRMTHDLQLRDRRSDKSRELCLYTRKTRTRMRSSLQRPVSTAINKMSSSFHPARWWWRRGGFNPCEHGYSTVDPQSLLWYNYARTQPLWPYA